MNDRQSVVHMHCSLPYCVNWTLKTNEALEPNCLGSVHTHITNQPLASARAVDTCNCSL